MLWINVFRQQSDRLPPRPFDRTLSPHDLILASHFWSATLRKPGQPYEVNWLVASDLLLRTPAWKACRHRGVFCPTKNQVWQTDSYTGRQLHEHTPRTQDPTTRGHEKVLGRWVDHGLIFQTRSVAPSIPGTCLGTSRNLSSRWGCLSSAFSNAHDWRDGYVLMSDFYLSDKTIGMMGFFTMIEAMSPIGT